MQRVSKTLLITAICAVVLVHTITIAEICYYILKPEPQVIEAFKLK